MSSRSIEIYFFRFQIKAPSVNFFFWWGGGGGGRWGTLGVGKGTSKAV